MLKLHGYLFSQSQPQSSLNDHITSFEELCRNHESIRLIFQMNVKPFLKDVPKKVNYPWDVYPLYYHALNITREIKKLHNHADIFASWQNLLQQANGKVILRKGSPNYICNFDPLLHLDQNEDIQWEAEIVNKKSEKEVDQAAEAFDNLWEEGGGWSFGKGIIHAVITYPLALSAVVKNEKGEIVGGVLGTFVQMNSTTRIFHFWIVSKKANYPHLKLVPQIENIVKANIENPNLKVDFVTLSVASNNDNAIDIYKKRSFEEVSRSHNHLNGHDAIFMVKDMSNKTKEKPSEKEALKAVECLGLEILGIWRTAYYGTVLKSTQLFRNYWYS